jgi:hypothetical protein
MSNRVRWAARALASALLAFFVPACAQTTSSPSPFLLSEGFDGTFPDANWATPVVTGSATFALSSTTGDPAPSLEMTTSAASSSVQTTTQLSFMNPSITISVAMADLSSAPATDTGTATVSILDSTMTPVATATWTTGPSGGTLTFHIQGGSADASVAVTDDGSFHQVVFSVSSSGGASWSIDMGTALVTESSFPAGNLKVELAANFPGGTTWPKFFFDNVNITTP